MREDTLHITLHGCIGIVVVLYWYCYCYLLLFWSCSCSCPTYHASHATDTDSRCHPIL